MHGGASPRNSSMAVPLSWVMHGELTRRALVARGAAGMTVGLLGRVPSAHAATPRALVFSLDVGAVAAARLASFRAPGRFDLLGFAWEGPRALQGDLRVRRDGRAWSLWHPLPSNGHEREAGEGGRVSDPVWVGGADTVELRLRQRVPRLQVHFVNSTGTATPAERGRSALRRALAHDARLPSVAPASGAPAIVSRSAWAGRAGRPSGAPLYGEVSLGVVHHTESLNDYGPGDSAAMVLAIARYHRDVRHWGDIGYNFVVDRYGQIFEGRAGGVLEAVAGAHAGGFNQDSTGAAILGSFTGAPPGSAATNAVARLLAWKLTYHGAPTAGRVVVPDRGTRPDKYRPGASVWLPRIAGHRDLNATECPGGPLYRRLPQLRRVVGRLASAQPRAIGQAPVMAAGAGAVRRGTPLGLAGAAGGITDAPVLLIERQARFGYERTTGVIALAPDRSFATTIALPRTGTYRLSVRGRDGRGLPLTSAPVYVSCRA
jgi:hypothetical protein